VLEYLGSAPRGIAMGEAVEAVAPHRVAIAPPRRDCVGCCRGRKRIVKCGVEARNRRGANQSSSDYIKGCERTRLVLWRQRNERSELLPHLVVHERGAIEQRSPMHDAMSCCIDRSHPPQVLDEGVVVKPSARHRQAPREGHSAVFLQEAQLEAARSGVYDKDAHALVRPGPLGDLRGIFAVLARVHACPKARVDHLLTYVGGP
jgi:hypothetical protein